MCSIFFYTHSVLYHHHKVRTLRSARGVFWHICEDAYSFLANNSENITVFWLSLLLLLFVIRCEDLMKLHDTFFFCFWLAGRWPQEVHAWALHDSEHSIHCCLGAHGDLRSNRRHFGEVEAKQPVLILLHFFHCWRFALEIFFYFSPQFAPADAFRSYIYFTLSLFYFISLCSC